MVVNIRFITILHKNPLFSLLVIGYIKLILLALLLLILW
jgi:hypothetical protein